MGKAELSLVWEPHVVYSDEGRVCWVREFRVDRQAEWDAGGGVGGPVLPGEEPGLI